MTGAKPLTIKCSKCGARLRLRKAPAKGRFRCGKCKAINEIAALSTPETDTYENEFLSALNEAGDCWDGDDDEFETEFGSWLREGQRKTGVVRIRDLFISLVGMGVLAVFLGGVVTHLFLHEREGCWQPVDMNGVSVWHQTSAFSLWFWPTWWIFRVLGTLSILPLTIANLVRSHADPTEKASAVGVGSAILFLIWMIPPGNGTTGRRFELSSTHFRTPQRVIPLENVTNIQLVHSQDGVMWNLKGFQGSITLSIKFIDARGLIGSVDVPYGMRFSDVGSGFSPARVSANRTAWIQAAERMPNLTLLEEVLHIQLQYSNEQVIRNERHTIWSN